MRKEERAQRRRGCARAPRRPAQNHTRLARGQPTTTTTVIIITLLGGADASDVAGARVLAFKNKAPTPKDDGYQNSLRVPYSQNKAKECERT
jgi:hypothetical protein